MITARGDAGPPRVGFVAGKRIGNAVERNRAKRRLRAAMAQVALNDDTVYLVIAGEAVTGADYRRLVGWLDAAVVSAREQPEGTG